MSSNCLGSAFLRRFGVQFEVLQGRVIGLDAMFSSVRVFGLESLCLFWVRWRAVGMADVPAIPFDPRAEQQAPSMNRRRLPRFSFACAVLENSTV